MLGGVEREMFQHVRQSVLCVVLKDGANVLVHVIMHGAGRPAPVGYVIGKPIGQLALLKVHFPGHAGCHVGYRQDHHEDGFGDKSAIYC